MNKEFQVKEVPCSANPITFIADKCIGCNRCVMVCPSDIILPAAEKGQHPIVMYPGECIYCGACVMECPVGDAIIFEHPVMNRSKFVPVKAAHESEEKSDKQY